MLYIALLIGICISFSLGYLWYGPLFGTIWNTGMGFSPEEIELNKSKNMKKVVGLNILSQTIIALVTYNLFHLLGVTTAISAIEIIVLVWLGYTLPVSLEPVLWDNKPWTVFYINASYRIVSYIGIALALVFIAR